MENKEFSNKYSKPRVSRFIDAETGKKLTSLRNNCHKFHLEKKNVFDALNSIQNKQESSKASVFEKVKTQSIIRKEDNDNERE